MAKMPYYGPAGIFSTDNAAADQRQIDAEGYDPDEGEQPYDYYDYEEEEYREEDWGKEIDVLFSCSASVENSTTEATFGMWWKRKTVFEIELQTETESAQREHDAACQCGEPIDVVNIAT